MSIDNENLISSFGKILIDWYNSNARSLPWRKTKDPYKIWLSEIILQQTTVLQGTQYYLKFVDKYPNIKDLAKADIDDVLKLWQGLGYYSRARNLHYTAQYIEEHYNGTFPNAYKDILSLKGVGPYTAAAISSFAFGLRYAVVDGNVLRLMSRYWGIKDPIDSKSTIDYIKGIAQKCIENKDPYLFNQSIMEFGALACKSKKPICNNCPFKKSCKAFINGWVSDIPFKQKKIKKRTRSFIYFFFIVDNSYTFIQKREKKDIWQGLYQFPLSEVNSLEKEKIELANHSFISNEIYPSKVFKHILTHQKIYAQFYKIYLNSKEQKASDLQRLSSSYKAIDLNKLNNFAWPRLIDLYLNDLSITLF